jgi:hypothetical protein
MTGMQGRMSSEQRRSPSSRALQGEAFGEEVLQEHAGETHRGHDHLLTFRFQPEQKKCPAGVLYAPKVRIFARVYCHWAWAKISPAPRSLSIQKSAPVKM